MSFKFIRFVAALAAAMTISGVVQAAEIKVLSAGAYRQVLGEVTPGFEKRTGHKLVIDRGTVGQLVKRIEDGEAFDFVIVTPAAIEKLINAGKVAAGTMAPLASVGVGVMVKEGAPKPDVSTVDAFKKTLLAAKTVSYIDPASGGSSGIYTAKLLNSLGIADAVKPKERLKKGGHVADLVVNGEAEIGIQQISEIVPVKGVTYVGPLPKEIQNVTVYAAGIAAKAANPDAVKALLATLTGPEAAQVLKAKGMEKPGG
jgi:molybdate transport system substrate-binding protein